MGWPKPHQASPTNRIGLTLLSPNVLISILSPVLLRTVLLGENPWLFLTLHYYICWLFGHKQRKLALDNLSPKELYWTDIGRVTKWSKSGELGFRDEESRGSFRILDIRDSRLPSSCSLKGTTSSPVSFVALIITWNGLVYVFAGYFFFSVSSTRLNRITATLFTMSAVCPEPGLRPSAGQAIQEMFDDNVHEQRNEWWVEFQDF